MIWLCPAWLATSALGAFLWHRYVAPRIWIKE